MTTRPIARPVFAPPFALRSRFSEARGWFPQPGPLLRLVVVVGVLFGLLAMAVSVRLECQELRKRLHRNRADQASAQLLNQRLRLELDSRRRIAGIEVPAHLMALDVPADVVPTPEPALLPGGEE